jgi:hypothetical protein
MGSEQTDRTELGLYLLKEKPNVEIEFALSGMRILNPARLTGLTDHRTKDFRATDRVRLNPHMHKRGSWFR